MKQNNSATNSSLEYTDKILSNNNVSDYDILYTIDYNVDPNEINAAANSAMKSQSDNPPNFQSVNNNFGYQQYPEFSQNYPINNTPINKVPIVNDSNLSAINNELNIDSLVYEKFKPLDSLYLSKKKIKEMCQEKKIVLSDVEINNIYRYFYEKKLNELDLNSYLNKLYTDSMASETESKNEMNAKNKDEKNNDEKADDEKHNVTTHLDKYFGAKTKLNAPSFLQPPLQPPPLSSPQFSYNNNAQNFDYARMKDIFKLTLLEEEQKKYHLDAQLEKIKQHIDKRLLATESIFYSHPRSTNNHANQCKADVQLVEDNNSNDIISFSNSNLTNDMNNLDDDKKKSLNEKKQINLDIFSKNIEDTKQQPVISNEPILETIKPNDLYARNFDQLNEKQSIYTGSNNLKSNLMQVTKNPSSISSEQVLDVERNESLVNDVETSSDSNKPYDWKKDRNKTHFGFDDLENTIGFLNDRNNNLSSQLVSDENYIDEKLSRSLDDISLIKEIIKDDVDPNLERDLDTSIELFENVRK